MEFQEGNQPPNERTPLVRSPPNTPPNSLQAIPSTSANPSPSGSKLHGWLIFLLFLLNVAMISAGYYSYTLIQSKFIENDQKIDNLNQMNENLQNELQQNRQAFEKFKNETLEAIEYIESYSNARLSKLEDVPGNDDVVKELHATEQAIFDEIESEKTLVNVLIRGIQANVTNSITRSNRLVDKKLSDVENKISTSEKRMSTLVEETSQNVSTSVRLAEDHIRVIETNLTSRMSIMTSSVSNALMSVRNLVEEAKTDINDVVDANHQKMEQFIIFSNNQFAAENDFVKYQLAGTFSLLACLICLWHITSHSRHISSEEVQKRLMAILWMVPIYSVTSWLSLVFPTAQPYLGVIRDGYEAYVVYTFIAFLKSALEKDEDGNSQDVIEVLARQFQTVIPLPPDLDPSLSKSTELPCTDNTCSKHSLSSPTTGLNRTESITFPEIEESSCEGYQSSDANVPSQTIDRSITNETDLEKGKSSSPKNHIQKAPCPCCIPSQDRKSPTGIAAATLHQCEVMAIQFVVMKPLLAAAPFFVELCGYDYEGHPPYANGTIDWFSARLYILLLGNISVSIAFYGLLCFFHLTEKELAWCKPWPKFLCVKGVVFMTFWQDILLQCMSGSGVIDARSAAQIQNLLICIEMFMASIAHFYIFPYEEWDAKKRKQASLEVRDTMAFYAFLSDFKRVIRGNPRQKLHEEITNEIEMNPEEHSHSHLQSPHHFNSNNINNPIYNSNSSHLSPSSPHPVNQFSQTHLTSPEYFQPSYSSNESHGSSPWRSHGQATNESSDQSSQSTHRERSVRKEHPPSVILHGSDSESDSDAVEEIRIQSV